MKTIFDGGFGDELPQAFGVAFRCEGAGVVRIEGTFLQGDVEKLGWQTFGEQFVGDRLDITVGFGTFDAGAEAVVGLPDFDVAVDFSLEVFGHVNFAFAEDAGDAEDEFLFGGEFGVVDLEGGEELVVVAFEFDAAGAVFLDFGEAGALVGRALDYLLQVADVEIERFHVVEKVLSGRSLLFELLVDTPSVGARAKQDNGEKRDQPLILARLASLDGGSGAAEEDSVFADGFVGRFGEIVFDVALDDGAVTFDGGCGSGNNSDGLRLKRYLKTNNRAGDAEADVNGWPDGDLGDARALEVDAVAGLEIFDPPLAVFIEDFDVLAANVFVFDGDVTGVGAADAELGCEFAMDGRGDVVNGDAEVWGLERSFHGEVRTPETYSN